MRARWNLAYYMSKTNVFAFNISNITYVVSTLIRIRMIPLHLR